MTVEMFKAFKVDEETESFEDQIKQFEMKLDLKDYYDIKRPIALFLTQWPNQKSRTVTISRFDLLCEKGNGSGFDEGSISHVKVLSPKSNNQLTSVLDLTACHAIQHPSTNSIFLV